MSLPNTQFDYLAIVAQHGHFFVSLSGGTEVSDRDVNAAIQFWIEPLLQHATEVFLYRRNRWTLPSPTKINARIVSKTNSRWRLDLNLSGNEKNPELWRRVLGNGIPLLLVIPESSFEASSFARHAWDPEILANLAGSTSRNAVSYAKRAAARSNLAFLFFADSTTLNVAIFAPAEELKRLFTVFVSQSQFRSPVLKREYRAIRR